MASKTLKQRQSEEEVKQMIVAAHRRGVCDSDGVTYPPKRHGYGHLHWAPVPYGDTKLRLWPRDDEGNLIGDNE